MRSPAFPPPPPAPVAGAGPEPRPGRREARTRLVWLATSDHMAVLHDGALRYDDLLEGQLGDILHFPECIDIPVFGSKTDPGAAGQATTLPVPTAPTGGAVSLIRSVHRGREHLLS